MAEERFGVAVDEEIEREVDELVAECDDLGASRSEIVEAILTAFVKSETNHVERVREIIIRNVRALSNRF
uniref:Ribbon-helix-helix protein, CopG family n=1 Tax=Natrinema halophilum TaxID=1699371 RepID=A0A7D5KKB4_9EURY